MELTFGDEGVTFEESLTAAPENAGAIATACAWQQRIPPTVPHARRPMLPFASVRPMRSTPARSRRVRPRLPPAPPCPPSRARVTFVDAALPQGVVVPDANLAVFSIADLTPAWMPTARAAVARWTLRRSPSRLSRATTSCMPPTASRSLARSRARKWAARSATTFLLEYADGDKLYVPLEQVDRITRYVGPDGDKPRLTRLNTADWTRATNKARKNAKKLAFDLVDLYTRRSSITGIACPPDTPEQIEMEESFPYDETRDQLEAIADIKADMEAPKPMDRLLCGDVGSARPRSPARSL